LKDHPEFQQAHDVKCRLGGPLTNFNAENHPTSFNSPIYSLAKAIADQTLSDAKLSIPLLDASQRRKTGVIISN
jgi:hypothetical protein